MAEVLEIEESVKDVIWEALGFTPLDELFSYVRYKLPKRAGIVDPEKLENFISNYMSELVVFEDGFVKPKLPSDSLWHATYAFRIPDVLAKGLELLAGSKDQYEQDHGDLNPVFQYSGFPPQKDPLTNEKCIYVAVAPEHAVFKRGPSNGIAVLEIDPSNNKFIPVDTRGRPIEGHEDLITEQFRYGTVDLGTYTPVNPDNIKRAYVHENDMNQLGPTTDPRITSVYPLSSKQWNRVVAEDYARLKG
ncbi:MAG: hypothetical protein IH934_03625 [Nanoarchaeota archaeon]|nr:hypothetical protein [Nanoarchaeota archaeon]